MLRCVNSYENKAAGHAWEPGDIVAVTEAVAEWLMRDSPGSFEVVTEPTPPDGPPADKRQRRAVVKAVGEAMDTKAMRGLTRG